MMDTWTPHGSSSCLSVSLKRLRAALEAPYAARQGKGWSPVGAESGSGDWRTSAAAVGCRRPTGVVLDAVLNVVLSGCGSRFGSGFGSDWTRLWKDAVLDSVLDMVLDSVLDSVLI